MHPLLEELRHIDQSPRALRSFGLLVGGVVLAVCGVVFWRAGWTAGAVLQGWAAAGVLLVLVGLVWPAGLRPLHRAWMALAVVLGFVMTRVILTAVFYLVVTPIGAVMRLLGRDPLSRRRDGAARSYWIEKPPADDVREHLTRYY